jgi:hypothetical protein
MPLMPCKQSCGALLFLAGLVFSAVAPVQATDFAVLLQHGNSDNDKPLSIKNPLFQESGANGTNPLYNASALVLWPNQLVADRDVLLEINFHDSIADRIPATPFGSYAFEINLSDAETGVPITQFDTPIDFCLEIPALAHLHQEGIVHRDLAARSLNVSVSPPVWQLEPTEIKSRDGMYCGKTDHFSIFAFGPVPEPSSLMLAAFAMVVAIRSRRR